MSHFGEFLALVCPALFGLSGRSRHVLRSSGSMLLSSDSVSTFLCSAEVSPPFAGSMTHRTVLWAHRTSLQGMVASATLWLLHGT